MGRHSPLSPNLQLRRRKGPNNRDVVCQLWPSCFDEVVFQSSCGLCGGAGPRRLERQVAGLRVLCASGEIQYSARAMVF